MTSSQHTTLIGRTVRGAEDDAPCPTTGVIVKVDDDPEYVWVLWGDDPNWPLFREALDGLAPR